jgi:MFS family permease
MSAPATNWPRVALLVGAGMAVAFQIGKAPPALPALQPDLGMSLFAASWVLSIFNVLGLVFGMVIGAAASALGNRRAVIAGLWIVAVASALGAAAPGPAALLATRFFEGIGFMLVVVAVPALLLAVARREDQKLTFGAWGAYNPAGTTIMTLIAPVLILGAGGWRALWLANAVLLAIYAMLLAALLPRDARAPRRSLGDLRADLRRTAGTPGPVLLALTFATYTLQYLGMVGLLPVLLTGLQIGQAQAAVLTALVMAVNIIGNLASGILLQRGVPRWAAIAVALVTMAGTSFVIYDDGAAFAARYGACLVFSTVCGLLPATVLGGAAVLAPNARVVPLINGLIVQGSNLGQTIGPPLVAAVASASGGWHNTPFVFCASAALGLICAWRIALLERHAARGA